MSPSTWPPTHNCILSDQTNTPVELESSNVIVANLTAVGLSTLLFMFSNLFFNFLTVVTTSDVANAAAQNDFAEVVS